MQKAVQAALSAIQQRQEIRLKIVIMAEILQRPAKSRIANRIINRGTLIPSIHRAGKVLMR
ncbi:MAG: hypothetical protein ACLRPH_02685 [Ruminococcus sp.]|nr:hypothetical protein [Bacillota bacterium]